MLVRASSSSAADRFRRLLWGKSSHRDQLCSMALVFDTPERAAALPVQNLMDSLTRSGKVKHSRGSFEKELRELRVRARYRCLGHLVALELCALIVH